MKRLTMMRKDFMIFTKKHARIIPLPASEGSTLTITCQFWRSLWCMLSLHLWNVMLFMTGIHIREVRGALVSLQFLQVIS